MNSGQWRDRSNSGPRTTRLLPPRPHRVNVGQSTKLAAEHRRHATFCPIEGLGTLRTPYLPGGAGLRGLSSHGITGYLHWNAVFSSCKHD